MCNLAAESCDIYSPCVWRTMARVAAAPKNPKFIHSFRQELKRCAVLADIVSLGGFQMNHVWIATLRTPEAKQRLVDCKELKVKQLRCLVIDPSSTEVRLRLHWVPYQVPDDAVRKLLEPYGKVIEVGREKWRVDGFEGIESTTRVARMTLKSGVTPDTMPHQLRLQGANALIVIPGRAPVCLRCKRTGHIRRECRVPKCSECYRFGHEKDECVKTYARVTDGAAADAASQEIMDADEAESASRGLEPEAPSPAEERRRPARPVTAAHVPRSNVENELAGDVAQPEVAVSPPAATVPEVRAATRDGCSPPSEETSPEGLTAMDETTESVKRALDESSSRAGMTPKLNPWMERTKKGRYQLTSDVPQDERTRRDSK